MWHHMYVDCLIIGSYLLSFNFGSEFQMCQSYHFRSAVSGDGIILIKFKNIISSKVFALFLSP